MDFKKIYKILLEIVADQNEVIIESKLEEKRIIYEENKMEKCD